jgi:hypothetical protein
VQKDSDKLLIERILKKVKKKDGCWLWLGATAGNGYGVLVVKGKRVTLRRLLWELINGKKHLAKRTLRSTCNHRQCINPKHLTIWDRNKGGRIGGG